MKKMKQRKPTLNGTFFLNIIAVNKFYFLKKIKNYFLSANKKKKLLVTSHLINHFYLLKLIKILINIINIYLLLLLLLLLLFQFLLLLLILFLFFFFVS